MSLKFAALFSSAVMLLFRAIIWCGRVARRTPMQMVLDRTMLEARRMLVSTNRSAAEIGDQLGFTDPAYFSRLFRAHAGESLRDFRKGIRA